MIDRHFDDHTGRLLSAKTGDTFFLIFLFHRSWPMNDRDLDDHTGRDPSAVTGGKNLKFSNWMKMLYLKSKSNFFIILTLWSCGCDGRAVTLTRRAGTRTSRVSFRLSMVVVMVMPPLTHWSATFRRNLSRSLGPSSRLFRQLSDNPEKKKIFKW